MIQRHLFLLDCTVVPSQVDPFEQNAFLALKADLQVQYILNYQTSTYQNNISKLKENNPVVSS
jgi:hypothetical protein